MVLTTKDLEELKQKVDNYLSDAFKEAIGVPQTREDLEAAVSSAVGVRVEFPNYDETTGTATYMNVYPPFPVNYINMAITLNEGEIT